MNKHNYNYNCNPICSFRGDSSLLLTSDPKPRLRWTTELHERFVDAVTQLGGPENATPKNIMKIMGVKGLTLFHLKSHLQKFRLGKQAQFKDFNEQASRHSEKGFPRDAVTKAGIIASCSLSESIHQSEALRKQMEVRRRLDEHFEVQERLQMRIDAQRKYMQTMLEKACHTICEEHVNAQSRSFHGNDKELGGVGNMKDFSSVANFPSTEELNIDGGPCLLEDDCALKVLNNDQLQMESLIFDGNENLIRFMQ